MTFTASPNFTNRDQRRVASPAGATIQCDWYGSGPPLVLVHGSFSDHVTNWQ